MKTAFDKLVEFYGSVPKVAKHFDRTREAVRRWGIDGLPTDMALNIEEETRGYVTSREVLEHKRSCQQAA